MLETLKYRWVLPSVLFFGFLVFVCSTASALDNGLA
jgi:hypothetical protein